MKLRKGIIKLNLTGCRAATAAAFIPALLYILLLIVFNLLWLVPVSDVVYVYKNTFSSSTIYIYSAPLALGCCFLSYSNHNKIFMFLLCNLNCNPLNTLQL